MSDKIICPILELYRGKIYCDIIKNFTYNIINKLGSKIFSYKKTCMRTLTNLLSSWIFTLYIEYGNNNDPFFPDSFNNITVLKETLLNFCKYDVNIIEPENIITPILDNFIIFINSQIELLENYKNSNKYFNKKNNYTIIKEKVFQKRNNTNILFYKYNINVLFFIKNKRLQNILENILIPEEVYEKMISNYNGYEEYLDLYIWIIIFRYQLLGSNNHQLGVLPKIIYQMEKDYNLKFECFASAINCTHKNFCSIYDDIEKYFGSKGNFFNYKIVEGTYGFNPPYQKEIINKGIYKILDHLEEAYEKKFNLTFILTIPIWDKKEQEILNQEPKIDYGEFEIINVIKSSKYFIGIKIILKENFTYLDHNFKLLKNKTIQNTYIILLSTNNITMNANNITMDAINNYNFYE